MNPKLILSPRLISGTLAGAVALSIILLVAALPAGAEENQGSPADGAIMWKFVQGEDAVNSNLTRIDSALLNASLSLSETGLAGEKARSVLENLAGEIPSAIDTVTVGLNGTILEVAPVDYQYVKGEDIGDQEQVQRLFATKQPVGMTYIKTVEGFYAMDFESPVFDEDGCIVGSVSVLINSTEFFGQVLSPYQPGDGAKIWVFQPGGLVIYDTNASQIGLNAFQDPVFQQFPDLLSLTKRVESERSGYGTYEFFNDQHSEKVKKALFWTTVEYHGTEARLMLSDELE